MSVKEYSAAGKRILNIISRPKFCLGCGREHAFHSHGSYPRYVDNCLIYIARFRCKYCALDVSVLPGFAMPYRNRSIEVVDDYFEASDEERRNKGGHDTLRRYWKAWKKNWPALLRVVGETGADARSAWSCLKKYFGTIEQAQIELIGLYRRALLKCYVVHALSQKMMAC